MGLQNNTNTISSESQRLRQAIFTSLKTVLDDDEATIALKSWALYTNGSSSAFSGINSFAHEVCDSFNKPEKQRDLIKALNRALITKESFPIAQKPKQEVLPVTKPEINKSEISLSVAHTTGNNPASNEFLIFQFVVLGIMNHALMLNSDIKTKTITFLYDVIDNMPLSEIQQRQLQSLVKEGDLQPTRTYKLDQLKNFLKYLKSWLGDQLGEDKTNELFNQVITEVEAKNEAQDFSPKHLI